MPLYLSGCFLVLALFGTSIHLVHWGLAELVMKTLPAAFLTMCALGLTRKRFKLWVVLGVGLGAVGDFCLWVHYPYADMFGVAAFLLGHIAYSIAFFKDLRWTRIRGVVIGMMAVFMVIVSAWSARASGRTLSSIEIAALSLYVGVMGIMMTIAILHQSPTWLIGAGAIFFVISDAHIAIRQGMPPSTRLLFALSGYITYYLGQYLLVAGAAQESRVSQRNRIL
ncbi:MAG: YhhN-like protein [Candidatus Hydrogenedentes bacterium ADurb.Bin179]|nr:MAG: YhhN-like protein [Candidatus Hydrogenedentes bacterium ADurb.Bin179]